MIRHALAGLALTVGAVVVPPASQPAAPLPPLHYAPLRTASAHVLAHDARGDGRRVEALGDFAVARHVAVVVPGYGNDLANFAADPDGGPPTVLERSRALLDELTGQGARDVAVVAWLGYDTPDGVSAARRDLAESGAPDLAALRAWLPSDVHVTWVCHSYGAVLCALAAGAGGVDDVVLLASPGAVADRATDLGAARVWAARTADDPVRLAPHVSLAGFGHGPDPVNPAFGARILDTGSDRGHSSYLDAGSDTIESVARVVRGALQEAPRD